tara:strand:+ start:497 stop:877 length:381 start_codon:yes stop_codon:yes gene_type:complete
MKEFKNGQRVEVLLSGDWHKADYIGISGDSHVVKDFYFAYQAVGNDAIRKESPSFRDVEIDSFNGLGFPIIDGMVIYEYQESKSGEVLSGYLVDGDDTVYWFPIVFNTNGTEIEHKATHARFVKNK